MIMSVVRFRGTHSDEGVDPEPETVIPDGDN
jgi:hypothetical protein